MEKFLNTSVRFVFVIMVIYLLSLEFSKATNLVNNLQTDIAPRPNESVPNSNDNEFQHFNLEPILNYNGDSNDTEQSDKFYIQVPTGKWVYHGEDINADPLLKWLRLLKKRYEEDPIVRSYIDANYKPPEIHEDITTTKPNIFTPDKKKLVIDIENASPHNTTNLKISLKSCYKTADNSIETLKTAQAEIKKLREQYDYLLSQVTSLNSTERRLVPKHSFLLLGSNLIKIGDEPLQFVNFILWEKLNLIDLEVLHANSSYNNTVTFELKTYEDKLEVLEAAKKYLKKSTVYITDF